MPCGYGWDALLSYETPKIAVIQDRRIGIIYYLLVACVCAYVIVDVVLIEKRYLLLSQPVGSVRFSLQSPQSRGETPTAAQALPYCAQNGNNTVNGYPTQPCIYWDDAYTLFPSIEETAMFITTRVSNQSQVQQDGCNIEDNTCIFVNANPGEPEQLFFIGDIENFTVMFDHSFFCQEIGVSGNSNELNGQLLSAKGQVMHVSPPNVVGQPAGKNKTKTTGDILTIGQILKAAGIKSLDQPSLANPSRSIRDDGIVIMMFIEYSNTYTFNPNNIRYRYQFEPIKGTKFKGIQTIVTKNTASRVEFNRHGIRLIIRQTGDLGKFDFPTLLLSLVSGMALITAVAVVLDYAIKYCRPLKRRYAPEKFIETEEWLAAQRAYETVGVNEHME